MEEKFFAWGDNEKVFYYFFKKIHYHEIFLQVNVFFYRSSEAISAKANVLFNVTKIGFDNKTDCGAENDLFHCSQTFAYFSKLSYRVNISYPNFEPKGNHLFAIKIQYFVNIHILIRII